SCSVSPGRPAAPPLFPYTTLFRSRQTVVARAMLDEAVGNAEIKERKRVVIRREHLANCAACTARDGVFLYGDDRSMGAREPQQQDRKSTRLNSSHVKISYAVFCLK